MKWSFYLIEFKKNKFVENELNLRAKTIKWSKLKFAKIKGK